MAARTGRLIQDQNMNIHLNGARAIGKADSTEQMKVVNSGGRKPLGDLSNTQKSCSTEDSKQVKSKNSLAITNEEDVAASRAKNLGSNRRAISKPSGKLHSDISNSKLSVLTKGPPSPSAIAEEIWHNHQECVKSYSTAIGMRRFVERLGLETDDTAHLAASRKLPAFSKHETDLKLEKILELFPEPSHEIRCGSPISKRYSRDTYSMLDDFEVNFQLKETPNLSEVLRKSQNGDDAEEEDEYCEKGL